MDFKHKVHYIIMLTELINFLGEPQVKSTKHLYGGFPIQEMNTQ